MADDRWSMAEKASTKPAKSYFPQLRAVSYILPGKRNYLGFYSCAAGSNSNRPARPEELKPTKYYWSMEKDSQGQEWMVIRFSQNPASACSYFKQTD
jgi:hypothetical protein